MCPAPPPPSGWPRSGSLLDRVDRRLSAPFFDLPSLGAMEVFVSVPGNCFGQPAWLFPVSPVALAAASEGASFKLIAAAALLAAAHGALWFVAVSDGGQPRLFRLLYHKVWVYAGPAASLLALRAAPQHARAAAGFFVAAWFAGIVPVLVLKSAAQRPRPCATRPAPNRYFEIIARTLRDHDAHQSLPSGDCAGAAIFAVALALFHGAPKLGTACVFASAFGRLYYQAHHLLDVALGALISGAVAFFFVSTFDFASHPILKPLGFQAASMTTLAAWKKLHPGHTDARPGG
ncbi:hypothetical protein M885DRAFT_518352 [Pelagophyceae sp. CCMP2097]|nr:hypothetical protein M885DRAFT_518352 [Pelagophyceae sp. CCMP2097]|mmetsp:Transcript_11397/g.39570  ORF Transcript_11397/g.39570 Transcript_11397/m.39570 type:complete len:290 (+) Transcript_11397:74-943(+)